MSRKLHTYECSETMIRCVTCRRYVKEDGTGNDYRSISMRAINYLGSVQVNETIWVKRMDYWQNIRLVKFSITLWFWVGKNIFIYANVDDPENITGV